jgi:hypothetical protein
VFVSISRVHSDAEQRAMESKCRAVPVTSLLRFFLRDSLEYKLYTSTDLAYKIKSLVPVKREHTTILSIVSLGPLLTLRAVHNNRNYANRQQVSRITRTYTKFDEQRHPGRLEAWMLELEITKKKQMKVIIIAHIL